MHLCIVSIIKTKTKEDKEIRSSKSILYIYMYVIKIRNPYIVMSMISCV